MPTIVIRHPDGTVEERDVTGKLTVGCDDGNDLVLRAGGVSQRHAQFFADGGELVLENVGSAAATLVDGEAIGRPTKLRPGVKVLIGEYEVTLKPDQAQLVVRKVGTPTADNTLPDDDALAPPAPPRRRRLKSWKIAATFAVAAAIAALVWAAWPSATPAAVEVAVTRQTAVATNDPCLDLESMLRVARDGANQKALDGANAALACDPLNKEAAGLKRAIEAELKGAAAAERGTRLVELGRDAEGLGVFREIPDGTPSFLSTQPQALAVAERVEHAAAEACRKYSRESRWVQAGPACEQAMDILCQSLKPDEVTPPLVKPESWKPREPLLVNLLKAREKLDPRRAPWSCPPIPLLKPLLPLPGKEAPTSARKVGDPQVAAALALYAKGNVNEAIVQLQVVKEKSEKAAVHAEAEQLRTDMVTVDSLQKIGQRLLETGEVEKGAKTLREALDADARLMVGPRATEAELDKAPSAARRAMKMLAAEQALRIGRPFSQHNDLRRACAAWRMGFTFYKGNTELSEGLSRCSIASKQLLDAAKDCGDLKRALELAVPGDSLEEAIAARKATLQCL